MFSTYQGVFCGEKADQLSSKGHHIEKAGFKIVTRSQFATSAFDNFAQQNNIGDQFVTTPYPELEEQIKKGQFSERDRRLIYMASGKYKDQALSIRSSAAGDALGTGTYHSEFVLNKQDAVEQGIKNVLASYYSPSAVKFRQDAKTGEGMGVIIEPIINQGWDKGYAPLFSGFAYSSGIDGEPTVSITPGLAGSVEKNQGHRIDNQLLSSMRGNWKSYFEPTAIPYKFKMRKPDLFSKNFTSFWGDMFTNEGNITKTILNVPDDKMAIYEALDMRKLFSMVQALEDRCEASLYIEWALTLEDQPVFWLTQIGEVESKPHDVALDNLENKILGCEGVRGVGVKESDKIVVAGQHDLKALSRFNQENANYVLIFSSTLTSSNFEGARLEYENFSNAAACIEIPDHGHLSDPAAHLGTQTELSGKFFGQITENNLEGLDPAEEHGLTVYNTKVKVVASQRQNKMIVSKID